MIITFEAEWFLNSVKSSTVYRLYLNSYTAELAIKSFAVKLLKIGIGVEVLFRVYVQNYVA